ncbi:MAG: LysR family transcriptional regulator [Rhodobacteraceae bacterium]|nr:LysR family transcriptional regulator [Paracoccaceae bacterium]
MDWNDLKYFLAVAREGQILSGARRLGVSQATLNRRVSNLERALNTTLFNRSTLGCELTPQGIALMERATRIETETLKISTTLSKPESPVSGTIRIGAPDGFGVAFLAPRLHLITEKFPDLSVQLVPIPRHFSLSRREADIAVTIGRPEKGRLRARKLTNYSLGLYASKNYLSEHGSPASIEALEKHKLVGYVEDLIFTPALNFSAHFLNNWRSSIEVSSALGQLEVVRAGGGIGILHDFMVRDMPDLLPILPDKRLNRSYWTVWHEDLKNSPEIIEVARFLTDIVNREKKIFIAP